MIVSKIAEYKQINTRTESYTVTVPSEYDEEGNLISEEHEETRTREVPVMGMVYRDMTPWLSRTEAASWIAVLFPSKVSVLMPTTSP